MSSSTAGVWVPSSRFPLLADLGDGGVRVLRIRLRHGLLGQHSSVFAPPRVVFGAVPIEAQEVVRFDAVLAAYVLEQSVLSHALPARDEALAAFGVAQVDRAANFNAHGNRQQADSWLTSSPSSPRSVALTRRRGLLESRVILVQL
jgi:hypothetical protein